MKTQRVFSLLKYYAINIIIWIVAYVILSLLQFENKTLSLIDIVSYCILGGVSIGLIWGVIFKVSIYFRNRLPTYLSRVVFTLATIFLSAILLVFSLFFLSKLIRLHEIPETINELPEFYNSNSFYVLLTYTFIVALLYHFVYEMDRKLGKGVLLKFLLGRYHKPKEEQRVFLFMDLKSSSYYAEKLGHFKYSRLAQDCFNQLSIPINKNKAQIHQFVGDEVVLTWQINKHFDAAKCIQFFIDFTNLLNSKKEYYQEHYHLLPVFKAGLHAGKVMVAQVGQHKSEIAYHGDAINTASRVQGLCNTYNAELLLTNDFLDLLKPKNKFLSTMKCFGKVSLKGKQNPVELYQFIRNTQ
ncbi:MULTISPECIES: adenylate/guanylate cyclase domain-containing protein [unclassified Tenacibaculum]|uniref:adenylate/guanylate cyclase domain-containing protein n=1 Tax=unclassified Tenacibaculum TaxID=2635139 RepID=UPI001F2D1013|nr:MULTISPECIES: adenylate/guanylate cyclase domain-containing protein [unclassified Tenacibaculum]MCF2874313.1 adenylate/guanylate cyclase domain-containing protein [Tenacibaculum sp. Cn5-1]MCF2934894.1 adenylate/guanylate cyclase domain-containing protein [Tenacibaculum sp. Cn5-34]MCG7511104.1 adenylate/guanylate cyclase domain-containing protein [Tenacibaculum sp. Cn5-46]